MGKEAQPRAHHSGFTLLEVLIALFVFTILSMILVGGLHSVIGTLSGTETSAERLRTLQMALVVMSRDIEQTVNRPVLIASGREEVAFVGTPRSFTFTHLGLANPNGVVARSSMQRTRYFWEGNTLWRMAWGELDQAPQSKPYSRPLINNILQARFQYVDRRGKLHDQWPIEGETFQPLPRAVKIMLTISQWGSMSQLYVISAEPTIQRPPQQPRI